MIDNLLLIRHGQSVANADRIFGGRLPYPLTEEGKKQAKFMSDFLANVKISKIYASPVKRTVDTANIIAKPHKMKITLCEGLTERDIGKKAGLPVSSIKGFGKSLNHPEYGETFYDVQKRTMKEIKSIIGSSKGNVAVVTHGDLILSALYYYQNMDAKNPKKPSMIVDTGSLSVISFKFPSPRVILLNYSRKIDKDFLKINLIKKVSNFGKPII